MIMKKFLTGLCITLSLFTIFVTPAFAQVTGESLGLFPCDPAPGKNADGTPKPAEECTFNHVLELADNIIKALFFAIMIIAPLLIALAGYRFLISGSRPAEREKAKNQLLNLVIGLVIVACAYGVVKLVLNVLLSPTTITTFF